MHSDNGNLQYYRSQVKALDRCLEKVQTGLQGKAVLDAAGGSGQFTDYFLKRGASRIVVADFAQKALDKVERSYGNDQRVNTLLFDLKAKNHRWQERFDFIFVLGAIFLLTTDDDLAQAINNLVSALKPGGHLIISDVFPPRTIQQNSYVIFRAKTRFEHLLAQSGLSVVTYVPQTFVFNRHLFGRFQYITEQAGPLLYWFDRLAMKLGLRPPAGSTADMKYLIATRRIRAT
jgi:2-polyprenyl-3-methyl-5-hydroxy-6-metoxy-1,4-benzoquinol methylase